MTKLKTHNLALTIAGIQLLHEFNVTFLAGEVWGIIGHNGAGKTTLLHTLAGLNTTIAGNIQLDGVNLHAIKPKQRARKIGLLAQDTEFAFPGTVFETALLGRYPYASNWLRDSAADIGCVNQALAAVQLTALQNRFVTTLSGGEKRRLALAMLLAQDPDIYLLDEPTNHLDIQQKVRVLSLLRQLAKQQHKIIIMVLHDINLMRTFCDKIILFGAKANYFTGKCADILCSAKLQSIFSAETLQVYE